MSFYTNLAQGFKSNEYSNFTKLSGERSYKFSINGYLAGYLDLKRYTNNNSTFYKNELPQFFNSSNYLDRQLFNGAGLKAIIDIVPEKMGYLLAV